MSVSYREIVKILQNIEVEFELPPNILKQIYDAEKDVVFMGVRRHIFESLREIIVSNMKKVDSVRKNSV